MERVFIAIAVVVLLALVIATIVRTKKTPDENPDYEPDGEPKTLAAERKMVRDGLIRAFLALFFMVVCLLLGIASIISTKSLGWLAFIAICAIGTARNTVLAVRGLRRLGEIKREESRE
jgi:NADH:ubiquinone oxidoreductase subunit 3 (subunit A)